MLALLDELRAFAAREFPVGSSVDAQVNRLDQGLCVQLQATDNGASFESMPALLAALGSWAGEAGLARLSLIPGAAAARTTHRAAQAMPLFAPVPPTIRFGGIAVTPPPVPFCRQAHRARQICRKALQMRSMARGRWSTCLPELAR